MSTQKNKIRNPKLARRTKESIIAEVILCKLLNWKIEFLSGGYDSYEWPELLQLIKDIKEVYGKKLWLNIGTLKESELRQLLPHIEGVSAPLECINPELRKQMCPSKPIKDLNRMLDAATRLKLKKSITLILGLGETLEDFKHLKTFLTRHNINQITFYRLKPQKETIFESTKPITKEYYGRWISLTRESYPDLKIIVGSWLTHLDEIHMLLRAGADGITKFPSIKKFNSKEAKKIVSEVKKSGYIFSSNLTDKPNLPSMQIDKKVKEKLLQYMKAMD